jgi:ABC-type phosphate/phosphonate transport system substrate-binding protein
MRASRSILFISALAFTTTAPLLATEQQTKEVPKEQTHLRMSISTTLFVGVSEQVVGAMMQPFRGLMRMQTGVDGELVPGADGMTIGDRVAEDKLQLAVMEGIEFAWVHQKHPQLKPLMVAVNEKPYGQALLVTKKDGSVKQFADLKGKAIADYRFTRIFSRLYLDRLSQQAHQTPAKNYFGKFAHCDTAEEMLDDVIDGKVDAAIIEEVCFDHYQRRKPARCLGLKVLDRSEKFPASVIVYRTGGLHPATQKKLTEGMMSADKTLLGRQLMTFWQMTGFEKLPEGYEASLNDIVKPYPAPKAGEKKVASAPE